MRGGGFVSRNQQIKNDLSQEWQIGKFFNRSVIFSLEKLDRRVIII